MAIATEVSSSVEASPEDVDMSSAGLRHVTNLVQRYVDAQKLPGALSLVARGGKIVHFETYGNMDDERAQADAAGHDLPLLLDDQAHRERRPHDAVRGGPLPARRPGLASSSPSSRT